MTKEIITKKGKIVLVDDADYDYLSQFTWQTTKQNYVFWAKRGEKDTLIHRLVMNAPDGVMVDHKDRNPLNNQKANLRFATKEQQSWNYGPLRSRKATSKYKGVSFSTEKGKWRVFIAAYSKRHFLGEFHDEIEAAKAYDAVAKELHGEFAYLNFG